MSLQTEAAREKKSRVLAFDADEPFTDRCAGLLGNFELDRATGLLLDYGGTLPNLPTDVDIVDLHPHKVTTSELAVDSQVEQCQIAPAVLQLKPGADCPYISRFQWALLPDLSPSVPRNGTWTFRALLFDTHDR